MFNTANNNNNNNKFRTITSYEMYSHTHTRILNEWMNE